MKKILITIVMLGGLGLAIYWAIYKTPAMAGSSYVATSTPTRLEQTQSLIDQLQKQRQNDPSFIAETNRELDTLKQSRITQSRLDALMIVQTQIDDEISSLKAVKTK